MDHAVQAAAAFAAPAPRKRADECTHSCTWILKCTVHSVYRARAVAVAWSCWVSCCWLLRCAGFSHLGDEHECMGPELLRSLASYGCG
jgi:hypothetical protein